MKSVQFLTILITYFVLVHNVDAVLNLIATLIQDNVAGKPVIHQTQRWPFNPNEGIKNNAEYEALNGHHSYKLIDRLGLGMDGRQEERKLQRAIKEAGVSTTSYDAIK